MTFEGWRHPPTVTLSNDIPSLRYIDWSILTEHALNVDYSIGNVQYSTVTVGGVFVHHNITSKRELI